MLPRAPPSAIRARATALLAPHRARRVARGPARLRAGDSGTPPPPAGDPLEKNKADLIKGDERGWWGGRAAPNGRGAPASTPSSSFVALRASGVDKSVAQRVLKSWETTGAAADPDALRKVLITRSLRSAAAILLQAGIDTGAAFGAFSWGTFLDTPAGADVPGRGVLQALSFALAFYFAVGVVSDLFVLGALSVAAARYGANAGAVLAAVRELAGAPSGVAALDRAASAVSTLKVVAALNEIADLLKAQVSAGGGDAPSTLQNLSALLTLSRAEERGFDAGALGLTRGDAAALAAAFAKYDANDDMVLQPTELSAMIKGEGYELTPAEEAAALALLDKNGDGLVGFPEFADWYVNKVRAPSAEA
jgi:hypothetical protein